MIKKRKFLGDFAKKGARMEYIEKTLKENQVFDGKILKVYCDDAILPDGKPCTREYIRHNGGACVLYVRGDEVLLVRQYRYPYGESVYEIPAGKLDLGEEPIKAAERELEEEGGIRAKELKLLHVMYPTPGYTNEKIYIYQAVSVEETAAHLDEGEYLDVEYVPLSRIKEMLKNGEINDGKTIIALQAYLLEQK